MFTEKVAMDGRLQSENPRILEAFRKIAAGTWPRSRCTERD
jgi:hypothetical protein